MMKWRAYFKNSVQRKKRYREFIHSKGLSSKKCPKPCDTRWTPWFKAVVWHEERHRFMSEFLESEKERSDSVQVHEMMNLLSTELESDFSYLGSAVPIIIEAIESVETNSIAAHHLVEKLADLKAFLKTQLRSRTHSEWKDMWQDILDKFSDYFEWSGGAPTHCQKGMNFFRKTRLLDPNQAANLNPTISKLSSLPLMKKVPVHQIQAYIDECQSVSPPSTLVYWKKKLTRWKELAHAAILTLSIPCHSAEVERSFSAYSRIVTKLRTTMSDSTVRTCNMMHYNCIL